MGKNSNDHDIVSLNDFNLILSDEEVILGIAIDWGFTFFFN